MKKLLAFVAIVAISFMGCKKDDDNSGTPTGGGGTLTVEKKNRPLLIDFSEDWCGPCGSNGGPAFDSLLSYEGSMLTAIKVYSGSNNAALNWSTGNGLWTIYNNATYGGNGIPKFIIGNKYQGVGSVNSTVSSSLTKANTFIADSIVAGIALNKSIEGDSMKVNTKIQFFKSQLANTDIRVALYVVEELVIANQLVGSTNVATYEHRNIVRTSNSSTYSGLQINSTAAIAVDQVFDNSFSMYLKPGWDKSKLKVVAVIWKMNSNPAVVLNSNVAK
ncbi:MAG: Omp28-related outer membrane protein [Bacteroidetes bacterium]|nr:Omp28-related outer membrane protein [Bacteroidota bacterium]